MSVIPRCGERLDHARVAAQRLVALVELVDGHVRLAVGLVLPGDDAVLAERDARLVDAAVVAVPADHDGLARDRVARLRTSRTVSLDGSRSSIEAKRQRSPTPWSRRRMRRRGADLVGAERVERMRRSTEHVPGEQVVRSLAAHRRGARRRRGRRPPAAGARRCSCSGASSSRRRSTGMTRRSPTCGVASATPRASMSPLSQWWPTSSHVSAGRSASSIAGANRWP